MYESLKRQLKTQQSLFKKVNAEQHAATRASFRVAHLVAKQCKPFTDGELIKNCIIATAEEMCPEKVNLFKNICLSANTVARRIDDIAQNISSQLRDKNQDLDWFSLAVDESTDVSDTAKVLLFIRGIDKNYEVEIMDSESIALGNIHSIEESGLSSIKKTLKVFAQTGRKQAGALNSTERGGHVTVVRCMSPSGFVPSKLIYTRKKGKKEETDRAPLTTVGVPRK
ncbi:zinc finger BED domain-containing protein 5-like [Schistocerca nitens]|uniref:zinc finger BED domain-containing protein 5-like n=1 Tax=Schistocerca nitens TaxID=7011 RepID=UPI0021181CFC|nr:zinc finger BED domain-containing protein 5-like [Schistocerca nitens]